jgi:hypothetical protein
MGRYSDSSSVELLVVESGYWMGQYLDSSSVGWWEQKRGHDCNNLVGFHLVKGSIYH